MQLPSFTTRLPELEALCMNGCTGLLGHVVHPEEAELDWLHSCMTCTDEGAYIA